MSWYHTDLKIQAFTSYYDTSFTPGNLKSFSVFQRGEIKTVFVPEVFIQVSFFNTYCCKGNGYPFNIISK